MGLRLLWRFADGSCGAAVWEFLSLGVAGGAVTPRLKSQQVVALLSPYSSSWISSTYLRIHLVRSIVGRPPATQEGFPRKVRILCSDYLPTFDPDRYLG